MAIIEIGQNQSLQSFNRTGRAMDSLGSQLSTGKKINSAQDDPVTWAKSRQDTLAFKGLQGINDSLATVATSVKHADTAMATINEYVAQMKAQLETIVKMWPPYPPGSQERIEYLRQFAEIRRQIDALTIPPDPGAQQIMSALPAGNWSVQIGENGASAVIRKQEVHTGPTGLNIPTLDPVTATDAQVNAALASLDTAQVTLASRRTALGADAATIAQSQSINKDVALVHQKDAERAVAADMTATSAEYKSAELKHELALQAVVNLTDMRSQLVELLR